jgi:DNA-binding transcriptional LysR family regulator
VADLPFVANAALRDPRHWLFMRGATERCDIVVRPAISIDATPAVHAAVLAGGGLSVLPDFLVAADLAAGRLIHVLPQWTLPEGGIHVVFPAARFRPTRVRERAAARRRRLIRPYRLHSGSGMVRKTLRRPSPHRPRMLAK